MKRLIAICILLTALYSYGQLSRSGSSPAWLELKVMKYGPYIGVQRGAYTFLEFGGEMQWKKIRLKKPVNHAVHTGFNYNFKYNVLGYDLGYWIRPHRLGLTFGANLFYRTNFETDRLGVAPVVGYKFWILHLQTGYHFMSRPKTVFELNKFFISLRVGIISDRDIKLKRDK